MKPRRTPLATLAVVTASALLIALVAATTAHAAASADCAGTTVTVTIDDSILPATTDVVADPDGVDVNGVNTVCTSLSAIVIDGDDLPNVVEYSAAVTFVAVANLGDGADVFTTVGSAQVELHGGPGRDLLFGGSGEDMLFGDDHEDVLVPGTGAGSSDGGNDDDLVSYSNVAPQDAPAVTVSASLADAGADVAGDAQTLNSVEDLEGTGGNDVLTGDGDPNTIGGLGGDDVLTGGDGDDLLFPGVGSDSISGGSGNTDVLSYANMVGTVAANLGAGTASIDGGAAGNQTFTGIDELVGSPGDDTLTGVASQPNTMRGAGGNDLLIGGTDTDLLSGDAGDDMLIGDRGDDALDGGADDDVLRPFTGSDAIVGGNGADVVDYRDVLEPMPVTASLPEQTATILGALGTQTLNSVEDLAGGDGNDVLTGAAGPNTLSGAQGDDLLIGGDGDDTLAGAEDDDVLRPGLGAGVSDGGPGSDTVSYADAPAVTANLATGTATVPGGAQTLADINDVTGSPGADVLVGDAGPNVLRGAGGADDLDGADGADTLEGADGNDVLRGGAGTDGFDAGLGDDDVRALDGVGEAVACGPGSDSAERDLTDIVSDCETLLPPVPPVPPVPPPPPPPPGRSRRRRRAERQRQLSAGPQRRSGRPRPRRDRRCADRSEASSGPRLGRSLVLRVAAGQVLVRRPRSAGFRPLEGRSSCPSARRST